MNKLRYVVERTSLITGLSQDVAEADTYEIAVKLKEKLHKEEWDADESGDVTYSIRESRTIN